MNTLAAGARSAPPTAVRPAHSAIFWHSVALIAVFGLHLYLVLTRSINWDEFHYLALMHELARGELDHPLQSFHASLFAWLPMRDLPVVDQIVRGRMVMWLCEIASCASIVFIARRFVTLNRALCCALAYASAIYVMQHGFAFRYDAPSISLCKRTVMGRSYPSAGNPRPSAAVLDGFLMDGHTTSTPPVLAPGAMMRWDTVSCILPCTLGDVLEIGCGKGGFAARIAPRCKRFVGLEPDATSHAIAAATVPVSADISLSRVESLPAGDTFDLVCAFELLEHLEDDKAALAQWAARLRPCGTLVISTPAHASRLGAWDKMVGHYRRYDPNQMERLLLSAGLENPSIELYGFPFGQPLENARNVIAKRRMKQAAKALGDYETRTSSLARLLQPTGALGSLVMRLAGFPITRVQRFFPGRGIALVAVATRPQ